MHNSALIIGLTAVVLSTSSVNAQVVQAMAPDRRALQVVENKESLDGAVMHTLLFRSKSRAFRYTPPTGWEVSPGGTNANLAKGKVTASLAIAAADYVANGEPQPPSADQLKNFQKDTLARASQTGPASLLPSTSLPFKVGNQILTESTVTHERGGKFYLLQRVKSWGVDWEVELELKGPEEELRALGPGLVQSLCSIDIYRKDEQRPNAVARENEVLSKLAHEQTRDQSSPSGGKTRGHLP